MTLPIPLTKGLRRRPGCIVFSNYRSKFKRSFETGVSRKQEIFVTFQCLPPRRTDPARSRQRRGLELWSATLICPLRERRALYQVAIRTGPHWMKAVRPYTPVGTVLAILFLSIPAASSRVAVAQEAD